MTADRRPAAPSTAKAHKGGAVPHASVDSEHDLVADLVAAHQSTVEHTDLLAEARQRRRQLAAQLHADGHSYKWIGEQIGVTAQAVEGFIKYRQRRQKKR
ncbi:hypothetical protein [Mycobacteroides chelonae]|uniref:hypothetical protein n=1 Tax=Mycobacteroides chelonae TaxID=1774 RepID=UPI0009BF3433|nr:hypothetical protein [Mycobacteroides chelonae]